MEEKIESAISSVAEYVASNPDDEKAVLSLAALIKAYRKSRERSSCAGSSVNVSRIVKSLRGILEQSLADC